MFSLLPTIPDPDIVSALRNIPPASSHITENSVITAIHHSLYPRIPQLSPDISSLVAQVTVHFSCSALLAPKVKSLLSLVYFVAFQVITKEIA